VRGEAAQFVVNQWEQLLSRFWVAILKGIKDARNIAHEVGTAS
jgi:hypothetical protein